MEVVFEPVESKPARSNCTDRGREQGVDAELPLYSDAVGGDEFAHVANGGTHFLVKEPSSDASVSSRCEMFECSDTGEREQSIGWIDASTLAGRSFVTIEQLVAELKTYLLRSI